MKKTIIILLTALLALSVFVACNQDTIVDDMFNGGSEPGPTPVEVLYIDADTTTLVGGKTYTIAGNVTNANRLSIDGNEAVTIILPAGKTLTVQQGITVTEGQTLIIDEDGTKGTEIGTLIAGGYGTTPSGAAGIGGVNESGKKNAGTITINGGTVKAYGGEAAAGIGGGFEGAGGTVNINGGTVKAYGGAQDGSGGDAGAGIGGGFHGAGGNVTINGGTVTATGGDGDGEDEGPGAGIGAGDGVSSHGTLTIGTGVFVTVSTDDTDWSVYDGSTRKQYMKVPEPIVLTDSTTEWTSGKIYTLGDEDVTIASRITVTGSVGLLLPKDKTLTASSGITVTGTNSLTINGKGSLIAGGAGTTPSKAAGIGGGYNGAGGTVTINGGTVTATGGEYAAGIGGGWYGTTGGTVTINGGTVEANGGSSGAGIGGGYYGVGGTVTINNGTVTATGGEYAAGIGGGYYGDGGSVTINGGSVTANGGQNAHGIGRGYDGGSDGTLTIGAYETLFHSTDGSSYTAYSGSDYSTRYQYMKADEVN